MKHLLILTAVGLSLFLTSCASGPERRISRNPQIFNQLNSSDQSAVREGRIREGMTKDSVFLAWGKPNTVSEGKRNGASLERWSYTTLRPVYLNTMGMWGGWGRGCGMWGGPMMGTMVDYVPSPGPTVEFTKGKVTGYTVPRYN